MIRVTVGLVATAMAGLLAVPLALAGALASSSSASGSALGAMLWDIPPELVPAFQEAGQAAGVPWFLLAGVASVATDFGRHAPDGLVRGAAAGTSIFPELMPSVTAPTGGAGMFLLPADGRDQQDVRAAASWLAIAMAAKATGATGWAGVIAALPLRITAVASSGAYLPPPSPGNDTNPIRQFGRLLLARLGALATTSNLDAIDAWAAGEGSCAAFNPLDTTQPEPGATPFNTLPGGGHVWNYPSLDAGVRATTETLLNGLYQPVVSALQASAGVGAVASAVLASPWGTGRFGSTAYSGRPCGSGNQAPAALSPAPAGPPTVAGPDAIVGAILARAARYQAMWEQGVGAPAAAPASDPGYVLPVDVSWYRAHPAWFERPHHDFPAVDIPVPEATPVYAVVAGRVAAADEAGGSTNCGHDVRLLGRDGVLYTYCHGSRVVVSVGQSVLRGELIMYSGWSGAVVPAGPAGAHLHFQIDIAGGPGPLCPQPALQAWAGGRPLDPHQLPARGCVSGRLA